MRKNMKRRVLSIALSSTLMFGTMATTAMAMSQSTVTDIMEQVNKNPDAKAEMIKLFKYEYNAVDGMQNVIDLLDEPEIQAKIQNLRDQGINITTSEIKSSLEEVAEWPKDKVLDLVDKVEKGNIEDVKDILEDEGLITDFDEEVTPGPGNGSGGGTGGGSDSGDTDTDIDEDVDVDEEPGMPDFDNVQVNFTDIDNNWANADIKEMARLGIVKGISKTEFAPTRTVTRSEMTAFMVRVLDLETKTIVALPFTDVESNSWDTDTIKTAYSAGIVQGTSADKFEPTREITREEMTVMLNNALRYKKVYPTTSEKYIQDFDDYNRISEWARKSMQDTLDLKVLNGKPENKMDPKGKATRAEAVTIVKRAFDQLYK